MIFSNDSAKPCSEAGKGLICFSRSLYSLQGASSLRSLGRRGSLGEWSAGQDWSQRHSFCNAFRIPATTANRNVFPVKEEEGVEARAGIMQNSEPQDFKFHCIFSAVIVHPGLMCYSKEQVKTAAIPLSCCISHRFYVNTVLYFVP